MKSPKTAFLTVVYPQARKFLPDFFRSLNHQTSRDFDLYLVNSHHVRNLDVRKHFSGGIRRVTFEGSQLAILAKAISHLARSKYKYVIFGDADDYFERNRVEESLKALQDNDVVGNDVTLVDKSGKVLATNYFSKRIHNGKKLNSKDLYQQNLLGFSTTAVRASLLTDISFPRNLIAVDWYLFSRILLRGAKAKFTNKTNTFYRQYSGQTIGLTRLTDEEIIRGVEAKRLHYQALARFAQDYQIMAKKFLEVSHRLNASQEKKQQYCEYIMRRKIKDPLWWEQIAPPKDLA